MYRQFPQIISDEDKKDCSLHSNSKNNWINKADIAIVYRPYVPSSILSRASFAGPPQFLGEFLVHVVQLNNDHDHNSDPNKNLQNLPDCKI